MLCLFGFRGATPSPSKAVLRFAAARTPMAPACVKLWTQCLQDLQQLLVSDHGPAAQLVGTAVKVNTMLAQWQELPPLSARDWRRLVLEVKVLGVTSYCIGCISQLQECLSTD